MPLVTLVQHSTQYYVFDTNQGKLILIAAGRANWQNLKPLPNAQGFAFPISNTSCAVTFTWTMPDSSKT